MKCRENIENQKAEQRKKREIFLILYFFCVFPKRWQTILREYQNVYVCVSDYSNRVAGLLWKRNNCRRHRNKLHICLLFAPERKPFNCVRAWVNAREFTWYMNCCVQVLLRVFRIFLSLFRSLSFLFWLNNTMLQSSRSWKKIILGKILIFMREIFRSPLAVPVLYILKVAYELSPHTKHISNNITFGGWRLHREPKMMAIIKKSLSPIDWTYFILHIISCVNLFTVFLDTYIVSM